MKRSKKENLGWNIYLLLNYSISYPCRSKRLYSLLVRKSENIKGTVCFAGPHLGCLGMAMLCICSHGPGALNLECEVLVGGDTRTKAPQDDGIDTVYSVLSGSVYALTRLIFRFCVISEKIGRREYWRDKTHITSTCLAFLMF